MPGALKCPPITWATLVDAVAGSLRLEPPARAAYGRLATLHVVAAIWGEIALVRAAERFVRVHHVSLDELLAAAPTPDTVAWFAGFLERIARPDQALPLPAELFRPAAPGLAL
jgi:hypothetical protein